MSYNVIIAGCGPAGMTAAIYAARAGLKTVVVESYAPGGQMLKARKVENYPGFSGVSVYELASLMLNKLEELKVDIIYDEMTGISENGGKRQVSLLRGGTISAEAVILCMGAEPKKLKVPGEDEFLGKGVSYCAVCDGGFYKDKLLYIAGDGNVAVEDALYLASRGNRVVILSKKDKLTASASSLEKIQNQSSVTILYTASVVKIKGGERVEGLLLRIGEKKQEVTADALFIAAGNSPASDAVRNSLKRSADGAIVTDEVMRTNLVGVFAAGDIRKKSLRQIVTACADGAVAANQALAFISGLVKERG